VDLRADTTNARRIETKNLKVKVTPDRLQRIYHHNT
jgi:hypothetical protein